MKYPAIVPVALSLSALLACGGETTPPALTESERPATERIVGGNTFGGLPAVGALTVHGGQHCTGTLVGPRKVLTAAHCVVGVSASSMRFVIGPSLSQAQAVIGVSALRAHPSYTGAGGTISNDIAYVLLSQDAPVAPLGVVEHMDSTWRGQSLFFVGYGVTSGYNQAGAGVKRAVWMDIADVYSTRFSYSDPGRNTCSGDSGGPAFYQSSAGEYLVAGVTSYGDYGCTQYGVDTRVDAYASFLDLDPVAPSPDQSPEQTPGDCGAETFEGRCQGNTVVWCEDNQIYVADCDERDAACGFSETNGYYACIASQQTDLCGGLTYEGACDGNTVMWCEDDAVQSLPCNQCGWDGGQGFYNCVQ